jgi:colicin import membrane protein
MSDVPAPEATVDAPAADPVEDQRVPYERFQQANKKAKEAADRAKALEKQMSDLQAQMEERESAGLPELERERKAREAAEKRLAEAEQRAEETERKVHLANAQSWISKAAQDAGFEDSEDAILRVDASEIESPQDAERAVKRLAKEKPRLLKQEDRKLPGQVLKNGQPATPATDPLKAADEEAARAMLTEINRLRENSFTAGSSMFDR